MVFNESVLIKSNYALQICLIERNHGTAKWFFKKLRIVEGMKIWNKCVFNFYSTTYVYGSLFNLICFM